jgi:hypothetical protein
MASIQIDVGMIPNGPENEPEAICPRILPVRHVVVEKPLDHQEVLRMGFKIPFGVGRLLRRCVRWLNLTNRRNRTEPLPSHG